MTDGSRAPRGQPKRLCRHVLALTCEDGSDTIALMKLWVALFLSCLVVAAQAAPEVEITAEPHHHQVFVNDQVRIFYVEIPAHAETLLHWHRHDYVYINLGEAQVSNEVKGKEPVAVNLHDGDAGLIRASFAHVAKNVGGMPFRNVDVELLHDDALRRLPKPSEDERALKVLEGGTQQVLWVKDGVRASEFELQPGAVIPSRAKAGAVVLVALNNVDLYLSDPRTHDSHEPAAPELHLKTGEVRWLAAGFRHPIVKAGTQVARFVTLEMPAAQH